MGTLLQDIRFGLRMLAKNPGFTAVAVLTLALGIGANTAIFSLVYGAVLHPFAYRADPDRLVVLVARDTTQSQKAQDLAHWAWVSPSEFLDYREQNQVFDEVVGGGGTDGLLGGIDVPQTFEAWRVTDNVFRVFGGAPVMGRPITAEDCKPGAPAVVLLGHKVWQSKFGGDPGIVGRTVILNHQPTTVIGVMPPHFVFGGAELWFPAILSRVKSADQQHTLSVIGHLKQGVTIEQAQADVEVLAKRLAAVYPEAQQKGTVFTVERLAHSITKGYESTYFTLLGAVGLLLLIGCVNVGNLLLARATGRDKEFAIRAALGASRRRLVRQLLIESLLLALGGAALGCLLAWNALEPLVAIIPDWCRSSESVFRINGSALLFTAGAAMFSTLLFGLAPALLAASRDLQKPLKAAGSGAGESRGHHRLRNLLVVSEVGLSLILLSGAGMLIRSFFALQHMDLGYNPDNVLITGVALPQNRYKTLEQINLFHMESLRRVRALPGVVSAALDFPVALAGYLEPIEIAGKPALENRRAWLRLSGDRYFETMGIRLLQGRTFSEEDMAGARKVAVVNQMFVRMYFEDENPLGRQIKLARSDWGPSTVRQAWFEIVGVVADTAHQDISGPAVQPTMFLVHAFGGIPWHNLVIRTAGDPTRMENAVRQAVASIDKELPLFGPTTLREEISGWWYTEPRFVLTMVVAFASLGLILVCVGVYSVLSYAVARRTQEIGVRMALGAQATDVRRMVMMSGLRWLAVGIGIGIPASIALAKFLQNRIWGIKSADPLTLVAVSLVLTAVGLAACYIPSRRATKVDPMVALRYE